MTSDNSKFSFTYHFLLNALDEKSGVLLKTKIKSLQNILNLTDNSIGVTCNRVTLAIMDLSKKNMKTVQLSTLDFCMKKI
jgi:hypothetical protein